MSDDFTKYIESDIPVIQKFMNENIQSSMSASQIYQGVKELLSSDINEGTFRTSLSANVRAGNITGFHGKRGAGYIKDGQEPANSKEQKEPEENNERFVVRITKNIRIVQSDRFNITLQRWRSNMWHNEAYTKTMGEALKSSARYLVKEKLSEQKGEHSISDAIAAFEKVEAIIMEELTSKAGDFPLDKKSSEVA